LHLCGESLAAPVNEKTDQLKKEILRLLSAPKYRPLDKVELGKALGRKSGVRWI
jgi:hypothetical protein